MHKKHNPVDEMNKHKLYIKAYIRSLKACPTEEGADQSKYIPKIIFYGVRAVGTYPKLKNYEEAVTCFEFIAGLKGIMSLLTLHEFMNIFPIEKTFDGAKYEIKDYYSTVEAIQELGLQPHERIGERILELIIEYMNDDIMHFAVQSMTAMSAIRRFDGHLDLMEEFMATQGMDTPNTFRNSKGEAIYVRYGKPVKLRLNKKQHLRIVK
ncbi:hypothetical protein [Metasolibacillus meyeri]|uniref:hypothetical protein n=1 Tax=Metasolibacillus meyeri TaxID=1071052 RepID=UPI000D307532|nr:hypothetical protein [Metasolibacillus meyeri]